MRGMTTASHAKPLPALAIGALACLGAAGAAAMSIAHFGIALPGFEGPGRLLLPVALGFVVGTALFAAVAVGAFTRRSWAWPFAVVVNGLAFVSAAMPFRGPVSAVAMAVTGLALVLLLSPPGRAALRRSRR